MACRGFLLSALLFSEAAAGHIGRRHLNRGSPLEASQSQEALREKVAVAFAGVLKNHGPAPASAGQEQPVAVQIEDKVVEDFQKELSPACEKRFTAMLKGNSPELSSFDTHQGGKAAAKQCGKLDGKVCFTKASVTETQDAPDGRKLAQTTRVEGHSCVPKECSSQSDLNAYAQFMHGQTANLMPGEAVGVALNVDCSASGGAVASIDRDGKAAVPAAAPRSGASVLLPGVGTALAAVLSFAF